MPARPVSGIPLQLRLWGLAQGKAGKKLDGEQGDVALVRPSCDCLRAVMQHCDGSGCPMLGGGTLGQLLGQPPDCRA